MIQHRSKGIRMQFGPAPRGRDFCLSGLPALRVPTGSWPRWVERNPKFHFSTQNGTCKSIFPNPESRIGAVSCSTPEEPTNLRGYATGFTLPCAGTCSTPRGIAASTPVPSTSGRGLRARVRGRSQALMAPSSQDRCTAPGRTPASARARTRPGWRRVSFSRAIHPPDRACGRGPRVRAGIDRSAGPGRR